MLNARQDSNIDKETAFDYFRKQKAFQKVVANKSYAQIVKSATYQNQGNNTHAKNFGQLINSPSMKKIFRQNSTLVSAK